MMGSTIEEHYEENDAPLLSSSEQKNNHQSLKLKTGTVWTAIAHIITALIGAGVLSLAWSIGQLGWVAGPLAVLIFAGVTLLATFLLCDCYRSPDPEVGRNVNHSYLAAVRHYLAPAAEANLTLKTSKKLVREMQFAQGSDYGAYVTMVSLGPMGL